MCFEECPFGFVGLEEGGGHGHFGVGDAGAEGEREAAEGKVASRAGGS